MHFSNPPTTLHCRDGPTHLPNANANLFTYEISNKQVPVVHLQPVRQFFLLRAPLLVPLLRLLIVVQGLDAVETMGSDCSFLEKKEGYNSINVGGGVTSENATLVLC